jgi:trigger factor
MVDMKVDVEQVDTCVRRLLVEVPVDRVNREFNALYSHLQSRVKLPGFRPGKVPRRVLENYYRHSVEQEALQKLVPDALSEALVQEGLHSVGQPQIDQIDLTKDQPLRFVATTQIIPDFTVADYRDWHLQRRIAPVDASQVEAAMQQLRERHAELHTVAGRAVVTGDHVLINYQGFLAGQPLPEAQGTNVALEVGAGLFLPEIEAGLIGLEPGMERTIAVQLPEDHRDATVAGQQVEFHVTLVEIKEKILPELDDEFARAYEDADSLDALRKRVLGELEEAARQQADEVVRRDILAQLVAANPIAVPDVLVQEHMRQLYFRHLRQETGREIREEEAQVDPESLRDTYGEPALEAVRGQVLLHRIQEDLGVSVTPEEVDAEVRALATRLAQNPEALKQAMERHGNLQALEAGLRERKVFQAIMEVIQITDVSADTSTSSS